MGIPLARLQDEVDSSDFTVYLAAWHEGLWGDSQMTQTARICQTIANCRPNRPQFDADLPLTRFIRQPTPRRRDKRKRYRGFAIQPLEEQKAVFANVIANWPQPEGGDTEP